MEVVRLSKLKQLPLFDLGQTSAGSLELFPAVWGAAEALASPQASTRAEGLERLVEIGAPRLSPLVAYLLATRITDPDLELRCRVVRVLGEALANDQDGSPAPEAVRQVLCNHLFRMRTREIYALLQAASQQPEIEAHIARLLKCCPYAGSHLSDILASRKSPMPVRQQAVRFISLVGYLDALPALERMALRLESRVNGQQAMPFLPQTGEDETRLLPEIKSALSMLRSP